jgi:hypothetical protein
MLGGYVQGNIELALDVDDERLLGGLLTLTFEWDKM